MSVPATAYCDLISTCLSLVTANFHILSVDSGDPPSQHPLATFQTLSHQTGIDIIYALYAPYFQLAGYLISCGWRGMSGNMEICVYNWNTGAQVWVSHSVVWINTSMLNDS